MRNNSDKTKISRRDFLRTTVLGGAAMGASLSLSPGLSLGQSAQKGVWTMKYDCYIGKTAEAARLDNWFLDEIVKRSDGRIKVKKYWAGSLHKVGQHLMAIRDRMADIAMISYGYYLSELPWTHGLEWYYRGCNHADTLLYVCRDMYDLYPSLRKEWEDTQNAKMLYFGNWNYTPFLMKTPLPDMESLKGRKIRGYGVGKDTVNLLGGIGVSVVAGRVYTALDHGTLDGVFSFSFITAEKFKLYKQAPYVVEGGAGAHAPTSVVMNRDLWRSLPDDLKTIIDNTAKDLYDSKFVEFYSKWNEESVDKMVKAGAKFSSWSDPEIEKATKIVQPAQIRLWIEKVAPLGIDGKAFQKKIDALIRKYEPGKLKRPWDIYKAKYL